MIPDAAATATTQGYKQAEFCFTGQAARDTRAAAFTSTLNRASQRTHQVLAQFDAAGPVGLTRSELADRMAIPINHVTRPVLSLICAGAIHETNETRPSKWGKPGVVVVHSRFMEVAHGTYPNA